MKANEAEIGTRQERETAVMLDLERLSRLDVGAFDRMLELLARLAVRVGEQEK